MTHNKLVPLLFGRCLIIAVTIFAENDSYAAAKHKHRTQLNTNELLIKLKERDDIIKNLLSRVEVLENNSHRAIPEQSVPPPPPSTSNNPTQTGRATNTPPTETAKQDAPGQFDIDVQASQRALERTLAKSGALLLPSGFLDTDFNFTFSHRESSALVNLKDFQGNTIQALGKIRQNIFEPSLAFRLGLPFDAQLEFNLPYRFNDQSIIASGQNLDQKSNNSGIGDLQVGIAKTLLKEEQWWPDIIARVTWNTGSGSTNSNSGIGAITGSLIALKRQDPLAFSFSGSYTRSFTENDYFIGVATNTSFNPGNTLAFSFGAQLAASSDTSLLFSFDQLFISNQKQNSRTIAGSNRYISMLNIGASSIITKNLFVNISSGLGLTQDTPDYTVGFTLSNRINLKPFLGLN